MPRPEEESLLFNRRSFLKTGSLALGATVVSGDTAAANSVSASAKPTLQSTAVRNPVSLVNLLMGTESTRRFSRGNTLPIAARPFGMAHWTLQSEADTAWMFQPGNRRIQGFRSTHQLSPWLGDYGHAIFMPFCGPIDADADMRSSSYRPEDARLAPHSLQLRLLRYGVDVELIPTERGALLTANFDGPQTPGSQPLGWVIEIPRDIPRNVPGDAQGDKPASKIVDHPPVWQPDAERRTIQFTSSANQGGVPDNFATYYVVQFSQPWTQLELNPAKTSSLGIVRFASAKKQIDMRVSTSFISFEQALLNLRLEQGTQSADVLRSEGQAVWNNHLERVEITGGSDAQQKIFYSCLYRTLLFPRMWHEPDANGAMQHRSAYNGKVLPGVMYADHGYWDVYRAWYPMMTVLFPERLAEILQSWANAYDEGGWLPQFPCPGYRACMTGSLIDSVFGDAAAKKLPGFDLAKAYAGLKKHATQPGNPDAGYGRRGLAEYLKYGYVPLDLVKQSAAETVDAAYGDFCIAQVAQALGHHDDYTLFMRRSESWRHLFDAQTGFLRGKHSDGEWAADFDPVTWGDPYVEGAAWQHRWDAPHDMQRLIAELGGPAKAVAALETMLTMAPVFNVGVYLDEIHEMSEMAAVDFGQYDHGNQPVHHVLYIFAAAGRPDRTRYWVRKVMDELYTTATFAGDEDTGSMAAWFILSALGFYPLCPGKPEYTLGAALFPFATVHLPGGKTLHIQGAADGTVREVLWDGRVFPSSTITHEQLLAGGTLRFT